MSKRDVFLVVLILYVIAVVMMELSPSPIIEPLTAYVGVAGSLIMVFVLGLILGMLGSGLDSEAAEK